MILCIDAGNSRVKWGWAEADNTGGYHWTSIATVSLIEFAAASDHVNPFSITRNSPTAGPTSTLRCSTVLSARTTIR